MNLIDSHETSTINCTEDNRGQWRVERIKLEEYITAAYARARTDIARGAVDPGDGTVE
ncbi:hypothetical protein [Arthrobacter sp. TMS2-4]